MFWELLTLNLSGGDFNALLSSAGRMCLFLWTFSSCSGPLFIQWALSVSPPLTDASLWPRWPTSPASYGPGQTNSESAALSLWNRSCRSWFFSFSDFIQKPKPVPCVGGVGSATLAARLVLRVFAHLPGAKPRPPASAGSESELLLLLGPTGSQTDPTDRWLMVSSCWTSSNTILTSDTSSCTGSSKIQTSQLFDRLVALLTKLVTLKVLLVN